MVHKMRPYTLEKKLWSMTEAAAVVGISYSLMRKLVKQGRVKAVRVGKRMLIPEEEVERLLEELLNQQKIR